MDRGALCEKIGRYLLQIRGIGVSKGFYFRSNEPEMTIGEVGKKQRGYCKTDEKSSDFATASLFVRQNVLR